MPSDRIQPTVSKEARERREAAARAAEQVPAPVSSARAWRDVVRNGLI